MYLSLETPPSMEPVSLEETKVYLRLSSDVEDALLTSFISASRMSIENMTGRALLKQKWILELTPPYPPSLPLVQVHRKELSITLPKPPLLELVSVTSREKSVSFIEEDMKIKMESHFYGEPLSISFWAGYGETPQFLPADLRIAVLKGVGALYEGQKMALSLLAPYRVLRIT